MRSARERRTARVRDAILAQIDELLSLARLPEVTGLGAPTVSDWTVGRQLEHLMLSDRAILDGIDALLAGRLESAGGGPSWSGRVVLTFGRIPRGKGRAPAVSMPGDLDMDRVVAGLEEVRERFALLDDHLPALAASRATYRHPILGSLRPSQWLSFTRIHHGHHMRIVSDIRRASD